MRKVMDGGDRLWRTVTYVPSFHHIHLTSRQGVSCGPNSHTARNTTIGVSIQIDSKYGTSQARSGLNSRM